MNELPLGDVACAPDTITGGAAQAAPAQDVYKRQMVHRIVQLVATIAILTVLIAADILIGPAFLPVGDVLAALLSPGQASPMVQVIVHDI